MTAKSLTAPEVANDEWSVLEQQVAAANIDLVVKGTIDGPLTIMGVPPGSGVRMGIDRNVDGVLDGDVGMPMPPTA